MFWKLICRNIFYPLALFLVVTLWFLTTESGTKTSIYCLKSFIPGHLNMQNVKGSWITKLSLENLEYENLTLKISATTCSFEPNIKSLLNAIIQIPFIRLDNTTFVYKEKSAYPLFIKTGTGQFQMTLNGQQLSIQIEDLIGSWFNMPLHAHTQINSLNKHFQIPTGEIILGENQLNISESAYSKNQLNWIINLNIPQKKIKAKFDGYFLREQKQNHWSGKLNKADFKSEMTGSWVLKTPSIMQISTSHFALKDIVLQNNISGLSSIKGNIYYGKEGLNSNINIASFFVPKQGLTLKNLHFNISGKIEKPLLLKGSGYSGEGQFELNGSLLSTFDNPFSLKFHGKNLTIYNTRNIQIIGSPELSLNLKNKFLFVDGTLFIHKAYILMQDQKNIALLSKDIVFTDTSLLPQKKNDFKLIPNIYVVIENNLHFNGYGIAATVGGKLTINERPDGLLSGNGKLTIKEGKYRLQGATRYIHKGYLLFPPGTLLKDPLLDILISQNRIQQQGSTISTNVGIYVQGTLLHPVYHPYSNDSNLKSADILSRLGFGQSETTGDENQRQLLAQTAFLFSGTANPFVEFLQKNLKLEEFNLESKPTNKTFYTQGGADTILVVGKSLSQKLYLQYLQSIMEPVATIRLKYFLSQLFTASAETGTEGIGADLTFSMEKN